MVWPIDRWKPMNDGDYPHICWITRRESFFPVTQILFLLGCARSGVPQRKSSPTKQIFHFQVGLWRPIPAQIWKTSLPWDLGFVMDLLMNWRFFFWGIYYDRRMGLLQGLRGCYGGFAIEPKGRLPTRRGRGDSIVKDISIINIVICFQEHCSQIHHAGQNLTVNIYAPELEIGIWPVRISTCQQFRVSSTEMAQI